MTAAGDAAIRARQSGGQRTGTVTLKDFDRGVVETLRAKVVQYQNQPNYFLMELSGTPLGEIELPLIPPGMPGIPITFAFPEDIYEHWRKPGIVVSRDDIAPAMQRYHPGAMQYNAPAANARAVVAASGAQGYSKMETLTQATPFDITYTISVISAGSRNLANRMLDHVLRIYPPYAAIYVLDSIGDQRTYSAWMEGSAMLDELADVSERTIGFAVTLRVEAEFDLTDPEIRATVYGGVQANLQRK
jgi:hypothetical protein